MKKLAVVFIVFTFMGISQAQAQSVQLGLGGGLTLVQSPDSWDKLDMSTGYHFGAKMKIGLPMSPVKITGQLYYNTFSGEPTIEYEGYGSYDAEISTSLLIIGAGVEFELIPGPVSPYFGMDLFVAAPGDMEVKVAGYSETFDGGDSRFGLGLGGGVDFKLAPGFDLDFAAKYNLYNLMGQDDGEEDMNAIALTASIMFGF
ncbi:MAG TPA: outer membrane beta-barrel protein [Ignavibacteriales bacterium]|nr:outer membrane beta-barrel protein [Ignavibacteriales bacterium]